MTYLVKVGATAGLQGRSFSHRVGSGASRESSKRGRERNTSTYPVLQSSARSSHWSNLAAELQGSGVWEVYFTIQSRVDKGGE